MSTSSLTTPSSTIRILTIATDPVILSGLAVCLNRFGDLQVVAAVADVAEALRILNARTGTTEPIDLVLMGLPLAVPPGGLRAIDFCRQLKSSYPTLPVVLLATADEPDLLAAYRLGIDGCCLAGSSVLDLVGCLRRVRAGNKVWAAEILRRFKLESAGEDSSVPANGLEQIERALFQLNNQLNNQQLSIVDRLFITGRIRELNAAKWVLQRLAKQKLDPDLVGSISLPENIDRSVGGQIVKSAPTPEVLVTELPGRAFDRVAGKLQYNLINLTATPLEIDILRTERKRELFYIILQQIEMLLDELKYSQITTETLPARTPQMLRDLWIAVTTIFFGKYQTVIVDRLQVEIVPALLERGEIVGREIIDKIPHSIDLFNYLLFRAPLKVDALTCPAGTPLADDRATQLLENLTINIANAVMQPLIDRFANVEVIKHGFFERRLLSTREVERFRNELSWRYRVDRYVREPKSVFESEYYLFTITEYGIESIAIYAPRPQELTTLNGIPLAVTLALETRDAIAPRLRSLTAFFGSAIVYILTEIIGRSIGLIGRGIIKGVGNIWQEQNRYR